MILPHADSAIVEREKVVAYLLNPSHPDNSGKARFFPNLGFSHDNWELLATALRNSARQHSVSKTVASRHGMKYVVARLRRSYGAVVKNVTMKEHERVVLKAPIRADALEPGDVVTVVHVYRDGLAYEVEFTTLDGKTAAVVTVEASQIRPVGKREIAHARALASA